MRRAEIDLIIGIDFDNTIADYELAFEEVAIEMGFLQSKNFLSKNDVKNIITSQKEGDINWQRLQGQIYGKYMHKAKIFPGFMEFLLLAKIKGLNVSIVSHKSKYGHFDENKVSLRQEALKWVLTNKIVDNDFYKLKENSVYFETTREEKINRIKNLQCNLFIDDLEEVYLEENFPNGIKKLLFDPLSKATKNEKFINVNSWRSISKMILGDWESEEIKNAFKVLFPNLELTNLELIKGRGNSKIYKIEFANLEKGVLKIYPDRQLDYRKRIETEFAAIKILSEAGLSVPKVIAMDVDANWAVYSWVDGISCVCEDTFLNDAAIFIKKLYLLSKTPTNFENISYASEACLSGMELEKQINNRFIKLKTISNEKLQYFLDKIFHPILIEKIKDAKNIMNENYESNLFLNLQILSSSDFGAHNAINDITGKTVYIDFEYFGWDDPVKLISDFYWHPAMNLSDQQKILWLKNTKNIFSKDIDFDKRLSAYLPLFGLRWCLILLNEFLPNRMSQRIHADNSKSAEIDEIHLTQLEKSNNLINKIININSNYYGSTLQTSKKINC